MYDHDSPLAPSPFDTDLAELLSTTATVPAVYAAMHGPPAKRARYSSGVGEWDAVGSPSKSDHLGSDLDSEADSDLASDLESELELDSDLESDLDSDLEDEEEQERFVAQDLRALPTLGDLIARSSKIVVLSGAGISSSAGIPTFRGANGLFDTLRKRQPLIRDPIMCLDARTLCGPRARPEAVYDALQLLWPRDAWKPTLAHHFLRVLHDKGKLLRVYTQNIDDLDVAAGIPHEKLVRLHGSFEHMVVVDGYGRRVGLVPSHQRVSVEAMILSGKVPVVKLKRSHPNPQPNLMSTLNAQMKLKMSYTEYLEVEEYDSVLRNPNVLYDDASYGFVRPDVTLYYDDVGGRMDVWDLADAHDADLVLVIGTALQVQPASDIARPSVRFPRVWINAGRDPMSFRFDHRVFATADVFARETARALGWEAELDSLASGSSGSSSSSASSSSCDGSSAPSIC